jgi:hypothetical protein
MAQRTASTPTGPKGSSLDCGDQRSAVIQVKAVAALAMACKPSVDFCGYWQRAQKKA